MCVSKRRGGMGFQNYEDFNQALLAKQAWRLVTSLESPCARVLRARYIKDGDFLTASCPKRSSFTWRIILHGRDLLREGLIWIVGDGEKIQIWEQNWIPRASLKRSVGVRPDRTVNKVSELLLPNGEGWDELKLNDLFFEDDIKYILSIHVGRAGSVDYMAWKYTKNKIFSVRLAYHLKQQIKSLQVDRPMPPHLWTTTKDGSLIPSIRFKDV
jgi:hypothetical protein